MPAQGRVTRLLIPTRGWMSRRLTSTGCRPTTTTITPPFLVRWAVSRTSKPHHASDLPPVVFTLSAAALPKQSRRVPQCVDREGQRDPHNGYHLVLRPSG